MRREGSGGSLSSGLGSIHGQGGGVGYGGWTMKKGKFTSPKPLPREKRNKARVSGGKKMGGMCVCQ